MADVDHADARTPAAIRAREQRQLWRTFQRARARPRRRSSARSAGTRTRAAAARSKPSSMPPPIVAPDRETPGTSASRLRDADREARRAERHRPRRASRAAPSRSTDQHARRRRRRSAIATTTGVSQRVFEPSHEQAGDHDRHRADDDQPERRRPIARPRAAARRQRPQHPQRDRRAEDRDDRQERADVARRRRRHARRRSASSRRTRAPGCRCAGTRDRQELGEPLDDAEQRGGQRKSQTSARARRAALPRAVGAVAGCRRRRRRAGSG